MQGYKLKVRCNDTALTSLAANRIGAVMIEQLSWVDTYFRVPSSNGRMKLRDVRGFAGGVELSGHPGAPVVDPLLHTPPGALVIYRRAAPETNRWMEHYQSLPVPDVAALRGELEAMFGVLCVVKRQRQTFHFYDVSIHFDVIPGVGDFVEVEVTRPGGDPAVQRQTVEGVALALNLDDRDRTHKSAVELMLELRNGALPA